MSIRRLDHEISPIAFFSEVLPKDRAIFNIFIFQFFNVINEDRCKAAVTPDLGCRKIVWTIAEMNPCAVSLQHNPVLVCMSYGESQNILKIFT